MEKSTKMKSFKQLHGAPASLHTAVANLEQFSKKNEASPIIHVADLAVHEGQLVEASEAGQNSSSLARALLSAIFSRKVRTQFHQNKLAVQEIVMQAIDEVKRNHMVIERLKAGSPEEQALAASTLHAIDRYNSIIEQARRTPADWSNRLSKFLTKYAGLTIDEEFHANRIDLPKHPTSFVIAPKENADGIRGKINSTFQHHVKAIATTEQAGFKAVQLTDIIASPLSQQEADLLRMKAHTLLRQHGFRLKSMAEMLQEIKSAPINTIMDSENNIANLTLKLLLLPGTFVEIHGAFQRNLEQKIQSTPIPGSFHLALRASQTGFPTPFQYTGWSLGDALIPHYPHRLDQMPLFKAIYKRKQDAVMTLQPGEPFFENARNLWKSKMQVFSDEILQLHRILNLSIISAAFEQHAAIDAEQTLHLFFDHVEKHETPVEYLSNTYQTINDYVIARPYALMNEWWLASHDADPKTARKELQEKLKEDWTHVQLLLKKEAGNSQSEFTKPSLDYVLLMGELLHTPIHAILLQYFSETLRCAPPLLTDFEQKLQAAALRQMCVFLDEIEHVRDITPEEKVKKLLLADIALFKADSFDNLEIPERHLVDEFEVYFNSRHSETIKK